MVDVRGYAWLTNARPPVHTAERLLLLVGMAGFLVVGLAIPRGFGGYGLVLGLGYLVVVIVHACLYYRVNGNIMRVAPFNIASALLVTSLAGLADRRLDSLAAYLLWIVALVVQLGSPLIVRPASLLRAAARALYRAAQRAADRGASASRSPRSASAQPGRLRQPGGATGGCSRRAVARPGASPPRSGGSSSARATTSAPSRC